MSGTWTVVRHAGIEPDGSGTLSEQRTYQRIRPTGRIEQRVVEIEFHEADAEAYCFTFA